MLRIAVAKAGKCPLPLFLRSPFFTTTWDPANEAVFKRTQIELEAANITAKFSHQLRESTARIGRDFASRRFNRTLSAVEDPRQRMEMLRSQYQRAEFAVRDYKQKFETSQFGDADRERETLAFYERQRDLQTEMIQAGDAYWQSQQRLADDQKRSMLDLVRASQQIVTADCHGKA